MSLSARPISQSYKDLLVVNNNNQGVDSTVRYIEDGEGTASTLGISTDTIGIKGSIIPDTNAQYDLGSAEFKIRHLYLSSNSLYIGGDSDGYGAVQISKDDADNIKGLGTGQFMRASSLNAAISAKADVSDVANFNSGLASKANASALADKADASALDNYATITALAAKADASDLDNYATTTALAAKADVAEMVANYATITAVDQKISDVIGAAPDALDTLNEIAAAIGDDADYAGSITTALASKADASALDNYATTTALAAKADASELANYATTTALAAKADASELANYATTTALANKADSSALSNYATTTALASKADASSVPTFTFTDGVLYISTV